MGAKVIIGNQFDTFELKRIIRTNPNLVTINATKFDKFNTKEFVQLGARIIIKNQFNKFDLKEIIKIKPKLITIKTTKFDKFDLKEIIK